MNMIEIKGFKGWVMFLLSALASIALAIGLPSAFMMTLWNAVVFEGFRGPEIGFLQGVLLWIAAGIAFKLIANPEIVVEFHKMDDTNTPPSNKPSSGGDGK